MGFITTIILCMLLGDVAWWWRAHRLLEALPHCRRWQVGLGLFFAAQLSGLALFLASRTHTPVLDALLSRPLLSAVYLWHTLILFPVIVGWLATDLVRAFGALTRRMLGAERPPPASPGLTRREFFGAAAVIAPAALSLASAGVSAGQLSRFRIRRIELPLPTLPRALDGLTIAHVSDLHVGRFTHGAVLDEVVERTNALRADLVLLAGDLINYALSDLPAGLEVVRRLRGTHGVFMCEGNHDLIEDGDAFVRQTRAAGVPLLVGESSLIEVRGERVQILGLPWGAPDVEDSRAVQHGDGAIATSMKRLLPQRRADAFPILLAHHPHAFDFAEDIALTLAGHTHGGQIMLSEKVGFGPWLFRYWSGLYTRAGRALVVSNGVGNWFPLRTHAPAEIIHLTLRSVPPMLNRHAAREG